MNRFCILKIFPLVVAVSLCVQLDAQEIVTAEKFMERASSVYSGFKDYEAKVQIRSGDSDMSGVLSYRSPAFLRIDFSSPQDQVIVFNGEVLTVYLPAYRAILNQTVSSAGKLGATGFATANGLSLLRRNFAASFVTGPAAVKLDDSSSEMVVKVRLTRRYGSEGFREIILSVDPTSLIIRRMQGTTLSGALVQFDFINVKTNIGIPEMRFTYDSPASANIYNNFLFRDTDQ
ncbi:MAG: outer-membrane lipoprotein carrier protein LolA [Spirochaetaceae bacterium]|nr:outer-membrane lipoprotein carrier protein LolA [Spirochaetaceae bacterium]